MPTIRARHSITETPEIAEAIAEAARRWPEDRDRPSRLLLHLIAEGRRTISPEIEGARAQRLAAIDRTAGAYTGMYGPGYLDDLRAEWPE